MLKPDLVTLRDLDHFVVIDFAHGACIVEMGRHSAPSVADKDDSGRFVFNESLYAGYPSIARKWMGTDWPINPVQSGNWNDTVKPRVKIQASTPVDIVTTTQMVDWVNAGRLPVWITQRVHLTKGRVEITKAVTVGQQFRWPGPVRDQEVSAMFTKRPYSTLKTGDHTAQLGLLPMPPEPPRPANNGAIKDRWLSLTNSHAYGLWFTTDAPRYVGYRVDGINSCAYVAPVQQFAVTPGLTFTHKHVAVVGFMGDAIDHNIVPPIRFIGDK
jgi:hypothetical protein